MYDCVLYMDMDIMETETVYKTTVKKTQYSEAWFLC